jgi:hypothetical protein
MKRLVRTFTWLLGGLFAVIAVIAAYEIMVFALSDEASALVLARVQFVNVCTENSLDPAEFGAPRRVARQDGAYEFVWRNSSSGDEIRALTSYLPTGAEAWLLRGEDMRAIKDRFKLD